MSLWADYIAEREGSLVIEEEWGFIEFSLSPPVCLIKSLYITPDQRRGKKGSELADRVTQLALDAGCETLWAQVCVAAFNATDSLKAILGYGFTVQRTENGIIILTKDIKTEVG